MEFVSLALWGKSIDWLYSIRQRQGEYLVLEGRKYQEALDQGLQIFFDKVPKPLLWAGSRAARVNITISGTYNRLNCSVMLSYQKVAGSIPDSVIGILHWHKSFWSHYDTGVDPASNKNEYQDYFLGVNAAWQPYHHPVPLSRNLGTLTSWNPMGHSRPVTGLLYT
jgi:hypothetical protein